MTMLLVVMFALVQEIRQPETAEEAMSRSLPEMAPLVSRLFQAELEDQCPSLVVQDGVPWPATLVEMFSCLAVPRVPALVGPSLSCLVPALQAAAATWWCLPRMLVTSGFLEKFRYPLERHLEVVLAESL